MRKRFADFRSRLRAEEAARGRVVHPWVPSLLVLAAVALVPWTIGLAITLPRRHVAHHWDLAWAGFDVAIASGLASTAYTVIKRPALAELCASITGTLLLVDAWFDISTAAPGREIAISITTAIVAEIPLGILCFAIARHIERVSEQAGSYLRAMGFRFERGRLLPPDEEAMVSAKEKERAGSSS